MAPKTFERRKRKASEASTSGDPQREEPARVEPAAEEPARDVRGRNELSRQFYAKERKKTLAKRDFKNSQYLDWTVLQEYGMQERIEGLIRDQAWLRLFALREPAYKKLTLEFLTTLKRETDEDTTPIFTFQVYGQVFSVQIKQIGVHLGLYDNEAQSADLPNSWPDDVDEYSYWAELIKPKIDDFIPSKSLNSTFALTEHKLLYHILSHTLSCKKTSYSKLAIFDMFYLFSLITN